MGNLTSILVLSDRFYYFILKYLEFIFD